MELLDWVNLFSESFETGRVFVTASTPERILYADQDFLNLVCPMVEKQRPFLMDPSFSWIKPKHRTILMRKAKCVPQGQCVYSKVEFKCTFGYTLVFEISIKWVQEFNNFIIELMLINPYKGSAGKIRHFDSVKNCLYTEHSRGEASEHSLQQFSSEIQAITLTHPGLFLINSREIRTKEEDLGYSLKASNFIGKAFSAMDIGPICQVNDLGDGRPCPEKHKSMLAADIVLLRSGLHAPLQCNSVEEAEAVLDKLRYHRLFSLAV